MGNGTGCFAPCDFGISDDEAFCFLGVGSCTVAELLEAEPSGFHDAKLVAATKEIRKILAAIPPDPAGRKLSFIRTNMGNILAWMDHSGVEVPAGAVTAKHDDVTIARALKLKGLGNTK